MSARIINIKYTKCIHFFGDAVVGDAVVGDAVVGLAVVGLAVVNNISVVVIFAVVGLAVVGSCVVVISVVGHSMGYEGTKVSRPIPISSTSSISAVTTAEATRPISVNK